MDLASARVLLSDESMVGRFTGIEVLRGAGVVAAEMVGSWIKPGRYFNAHFHLTDGVGRKVAQASAFALGFEEATRRASKLNRATCTVTAPGLLLQCFPDDYRLPYLGECLRLSRVAPLLGDSGSRLTAEVAGYRPGMRCQIRYGVGEQVWFGKTAYERDPGRAFAVYGRVQAALEAASGAITAPPPFRYVAPLGLSLIHGGRGTSIYACLRSGAEFQAGGRVAQALACLHDLDGTQFERVYRPGDEVELLATWVELVAALEPARAPGLRRAYAAIATACPDPSRSPSVVHRDFYDKQILCTGDRFTLLDLDTVCRGDREIDLANFCAHLRLRGLQYGNPDGLKAAAAEFVAAYPGGFDPSRLRWYYRAALLRLACNYALRPAWKTLAPRLIEASEDS